MSDLYKEHNFHTDEWLSDCSECYKDMQRFLNQPRYERQNDLRNGDLDLASERSAHPEINYWR